MFCVENPYTDPGTTAAIDTDYAIAICPVHLGAAETSSTPSSLTAGARGKGDALMSDSAGALKEIRGLPQAVDRGGAATYTIAVPDRVIVTFADQDLNNSAGGCARIRYAQPGFWFIRVQVFQR